MLHTRRQKEDVSLRSEPPVYETRRAIGQTGHTGRDSCRGECGVETPALRHQSGSDIASVWLTINVICHAYTSLLYLLRGTGCNGQNVCRGGGGGRGTGALGVGGRLR